MIRKLLLVVGLVLCNSGPAEGQIRRVPMSAKGGQPQGEPWADVPESFRGISFPQWPVPTELNQWQNVDRAKTRDTLFGF